MKIGEMIYQSVIVRVLPLMTPAQKDQFEKLLNKDVTPDDLMKFLGEQIPDFETIVREEAERFYREAMEVLG